MEYFLNSVSAVDVKAYGGWPLIAELRRKWLQIVLLPVPEPFEP